MDKIDWNTAAGLIDFSGKQAVSESLAQQQLQGAVALHNMLASEDGVAYLADEVGMGKTYIALGVVALMRRFQPGLRVLYLLPKNNVRDKWQKDYLSFIDKNYLLHDGVVKGFGNAPAAPFRLCETLPHLVQAAATNSARDYFICTSAFSLSLGDTRAELADALEKFRHALPQYAVDVDLLTQELERNKGDDAALPDLKSRVKRCWAAALNAILPRFDLVVVDEAHNYRRGIDSSDRNRLLATVLGTQADDQQPSTPRVTRLLLLSATPFDRDIEQLRRQLQLFGKQHALKLAAGASWEEVHAALAPFMVRRLNSLTFGETVHTRNMYRAEHRSGKDAEIKLGLHQQLFAALMQKKVSESLHENNNGKFELGMLASFESYLPSNKNQPVLFDGAEERRATPGDGDAADRGVVEWLVNDYNKQFGQFPPHPKMDDVAGRAGDAAFAYNKKQLIFARRVGSVGELKAKLEDHYNRWIGDYIATDGEVAHWYGVYKDLARRRESGRLDDEQDGDNANISSFFAWFYRGANDLLAQAGSGLQPTPANYRNTLTESAMFATNWSTLPGMPAPESVDFTVLSRLPSLPANPKRAQFFERGQHAYLRAVASGESAAALVASRILALAFDDVGSTAGPVDRAALVEEIGQKPIWDVLRDSTSPLSELGRDWSSATFDLMAGGDAAAAEQAIRHVLVHHRLAAAVCRLDHPFIDLYALRASRGKSDSEDSADDKLIKAFAQRLLEQSERPHAFSSFVILRDLAANLELLLKQNFEYAMSKRASELTVYLTRQLQPLSPVLGATGANSDSRSAIARKFRMPGYPRVLVSTDVFQEGEDLHTFCDSVIHYGISASPIALEQKVGRVDRIASLSHRNMAGAGNAPQAHFIQVRFPHIRESLEFLQVRQAARNLNQFLLSMNRIGDATPQPKPLIDIGQQLQDASPIEAPLMTMLESPFSIPANAFEGVDRRVQVAREQHAFEARVAHGKRIVERQLTEKTAHPVALAASADGLAWQGPEGQRVALRGAKGMPHLLLSVSMLDLAPLDLARADGAAAPSYLSDLQTNPLARLQLASDHDKHLAPGLQRNAEIYAGAADILSALEVKDVYLRVTDPAWQGDAPIAAMPDIASLMRGLYGQQGAYRIAAGSGQALVFHFDLEQRQQEVQWQVSGNYVVFTAQVLSAEQTTELASSKGKLVANTLERNFAFDMVDFHISADLALAVRALHPLGHLDHEELAFTATLVASEADRLRQIMFADPLSDGDEDAPTLVRRENGWRIWAEDNHVMCKIREILADGPLSADNLIKKMGHALGYQRVTAPLASALEGVLLAAARRKITVRDGGIVYLATRSISEYEDEDLSTQYLAALRKQGTGWVEQDQVMRAFAHRLGFLRAGSAIRERGEVQIRKLRRAKVVTISGQEIRLC